MNKNVPGGQERSHLYLTLRRVAFEDDQRVLCDGQGRKVWLKFLPRKEELVLECSPPRPAVL